MSSLVAVRRILNACAVAAALAVTSGPLLGQTRAVLERYTAMAVNMGDVGRPGAGTVQIVVNRWSTDGERDRLMAVLLDKGPDPLLDALRETPTVGYIRTPNSLAYDLHYAHKTPGEDGGDRVVLATDRRIEFWEVMRQSRTLDYPFLVIEIHFNSDGVGEGKLSLATKIVADKKSDQIVLENYGTQPVMLKSVRRESGGR